MALSFDVRLRLGRSSRARLAHANQRGAAVMVVLLVVVMLTGLGVFATRAAMLATMASGFDRQMTQTHYITEYAVLTTTAELSTDRRNAYIKAMASTPDPLCTSIQSASAVKVTNFSCYRFGYSDLQTQMAVANSNVLVNQYVPGSPPVGGGLGFAPIQADWMIEMTDLGPASPPVAGTDLTSAGAVSVQYMAVTLNATGQVKATPINAGTIDATAAKTASIETSRAHLVVGPLPKL